MENILPTKLRIVHFPEDKEVNVFIEEPQVEVWNTIITRGKEQHKEVIELMVKLYNEYMNRENKTPVHLLEKDLKDCLVASDSLTNQISKLNALRDVCSNFLKAIGHHEISVYQNNDNVPDFVQQMEDNL